jgi:tight adherence protein C
MTLLGNVVALIIIAAVVVVIVAAILVVIGSRLPKEAEDPLEQRLAEFAQRGEQASLEEIEMSQPFSDRVLYPTLRTMGELSARFTPQKQIQDTERRLELAGNPGNLDAASFLSTRFVVAGLFAVITFAVAAYLSRVPTSRALLYAAGGLLVGFYFPQLWLRDQIAKRQENIRKAMPDALDLLTICVEAGLGFDAAMSKVAEKWTNELSAGFLRAIREIQLGKLRREALRDMAERMGIPEMTSFVAAVIQSEQLGVSMAKVLRIQSDQMRMKRRQRAEERAHAAPIKMIIPMAIFIFPPIFILLLTPAALRFVQAGL